MNLERIKNIIWDWNGTLLNDVDICIQSMNSLLGRRKLSLMDVNKYREVFTFPVKDYYLKLGFDFSTEPFEIPAMEFIDEYRKNLPNASLQEGGLEILQTFRERGYRQFILSAMEQEALSTSVKSLGIEHFFLEIRGIQDHFAHGKDHVAQELIRRNNLYGYETLLIGDTLHDAEVAAVSGIHCLLIATGHQSESRLKELGIPVFMDISEILSLLKT
jgi:phosphoglycolate phosphatase